MNPRRWQRLLLAITTIILVVLTILLLLRIEPSHKRLVDWEPIQRGIEAYLRDEAAANRRHPEVVLNDLVRKGYLAPNALDAFDGAEITLSLRPEPDDFPDGVRARARMPNEGGDVVLLADGSIQQVKTRSIPPGGSFSR